MKTYLIRLAFLFSVLGGQSAWAATDSSVNVMSLDQPNWSRKSCRPCFEYHDGWFSYIMVQDGKVISSSALYGDETECERVRKLDKVCNSGASNSFAEP